MLRAFQLERQYRRDYSPASFDLSSSAPEPLTMRDVLAAGGASFDALLAQPLGYERGGGGLELRSRVADLYRTLTADDVLITAGAVEAIHAVALALGRPGSCVLVQTPSYAALAGAFRMRGAEVVPWLPGPDGWHDAADLGRYEGGSVEALVVNRPHGPTGAIVDALPSTWRVVADEVYRPIELVPGTAVPSLADLDPRHVSIGDLSKPLGLGGLRIGWIVTRDRAFLERCGDALDYLSGSVSAVSARIAEVALTHFDALLVPHLERARGNLQRLTVILDRHTQHVEWLPPQAGYTAAVRMRGGAHEAARVRTELLRDGCFVLDGTALGDPSLLRIGFGGSEPGFATALDSLDRTLGALPRSERRPARAPVMPAPERARDVIVLAKAPLPGYSKTRLGRDLGAVEAARLSAAFLADTVRLARGSSERLLIAYAPPEQRDTFAALAPQATLIEQAAGDLGARLHAAFERAFALGAHAPVLVGSDSPTLPGSLLPLAARLLAHADVVLGPAEDGGYYLIGMRSPHSELFHDVSWGGPEVLAQTLERARDGGLRVAMLPYWYDVDTVEDLARLAGDAGAANATRELARLGAPEARSAVEVPA